MNFNDKTAPSQTESISFEFDLAHPPEKIWRALTDPALLAEWLLPVVGFKLESGVAFTFNASPQPGWDGIVNCRLRDVELYKKISWAWVVGDIDTVVTFSLTSVDGGSRTRLSIVQSGFKPDQRQAFGGARYGWGMMSRKLVDLLGRIP